MCLRRRRGLTNPGMGRRQFVDRRRRIGGYLFSHCAEDEESAGQCFGFLDEGGLGRGVSEGSVG